jgi:nucleotide sugar dehydrogenase
MIGIIGYGMVGKAVEYGFDKTECIISDPAYGLTDIVDVVQANPEVIFVCVPTPTDKDKYSLLQGVLADIKQANYTGIVVVKSTVLPQYIDDFDVVYNPEFLSRATANTDFVNPPFVLLGGPSNLTKQVADVYRKYSKVKLEKIIYTDIKTAALAKYTMNSFYATKVTFMNQMYDVARELDVNWNGIVDILKQQPWMGTHHFDVPGPDGDRGFGGPCLPKDTEALAKEYDLELLKIVLSLNNQYRN